MVNFDLKEAALGVSNFGCLLLKLILIIQS